jgi:acyl carrier protein
MRVKILEIYPLSINKVLQSRYFIKGDYFLENKLIIFIKKELSNDLDAEIKSNTKLISSGLIDSFSLVTLQIYIEKEFGVKIPAPRITADTFDTVEQMTSIIRQYL